jgi:hypothetical protein
MSSRPSSLLPAIGLALLLFGAAIGTPADADLWGHLTFGRDIVTEGTIVQPDLYSFTADRPWVNHEWLAEVVFFSIYRFGGSAGLIAWKAAMIAALCGLVWWRVRRVGAGRGIALSLIALAFAGTYWRMHSVRPQVFSVLLFAILLIAIVQADAGRRRALLVVPPLMALWVNLHGGWIVGIGVLGLWTAIRVLDSRIPLRERLVPAAAGLAALAATLLNPYGAHMWTFLAETVRFGRADIEDWGSILTNPVLLGVPWGLTVIAAGFAVWQSDRSRRLDYVPIVALLAIASFQVSRLDAFFAIAVVILLAPELRAAVEHFMRPGVTREAPAAPAFGIIVVTVIAVAAMLVPAAKIIGPYAACLTIGGRWAPDEAAGRFILHNRLKGRMLTWFDWGQYAIWHYGPHLQVSMDGRRETVYTAGTIQAHRRFYAADETASSYLRALNPDFIWLPTRLPITSTLAQAGWQPVFTGKVSVVFARAGAGPFEQVAISRTGMRCFPGP